MTSSRRRCRGEGSSTCGCHPGGADNTHHGQACASFGAPGREAALPARSARVGATSSVRPPSVPGHRRAFSPDMPEHSRHAVDCRGRSRHCWRRRGHETHGRCIHRATHEVPDRLRFGETSHPSRATRTWPGRCLVAPARRFVGASISTIGRSASREHGESPRCQCATVRSRRALGHEPTGGWSCALTTS